jgi:hypothetical protein
MADGRPDCYCHYVQGLLKEVLKVKGVYKQSIQQIDPNFVNFVLDGQIQTVTAREPMTEILRRWRRPRAWRRRCRRARGPPSPAHQPYSVACSSAA